jgi:hypothetical protein
VQALPPPRRTPLTPPLVPVQQTPAGADAGTEDGVTAERRVVPAPRPEPRSEPGGRYGLPGVRTRIAQPDAVVFTAPCPACGADCDWTEQREDTRLRAVVGCPCG